MAISQFDRLDVFLFILVSISVGPLVLTSGVIPRSEKFEIDLLVGPGGALFLARYKDLVNLLGLFSLFDHLPQYFFQHSIFGRLFADAIRRDLARTEVDGVSVHPRSGVAHFAEGLIRLLSSSLSSLHSPFDLFLALIAKFLQGSIIFARSKLSLIFLVNFLDSGLFHFHFGSLVRRSDET